MVHCGYEPTAVDHTFSSFGGFFSTVKATLFSRYASPRAKKRLEEEKHKPHGPMVQLGLAGVGDNAEAHHDAPENQQATPDSEQESREPVTAGAA